MPEALSLLIISGGFMAFLTAILGGILTFFTPCVLPIVPPYLAYMSGLSLSTLQSKEETKGQWRKILPSALLFVLGFGLIFVILGLAFTSLSQFMRAYIPQMRSVAGFLIFFMGLVILKPASLEGIKKHFIGWLLLLVALLGLARSAGLINWPVDHIMPMLVLVLALLALGFFHQTWFYREVRFNPNHGKNRLLSSFVMGLAFAFGWTACTGPLLASVLMVAGEYTQTPFAGAGVMIGFALGLAVPFVLAALATSTVLSWMSGVRRYLGIIEYSIALLLIAAGLAILSGLINSIALWMETFIPAL